MKQRLIIMASGLAIIAMSCSKQKEDEIQPPTGNSCDTTFRQYAAHVEPILAAHCYTCHGMEFNGGSGGIILEGYENLKVKAASGELIGTISHAEGFNPMPRNAPKLSDCDINTIRSWINNGMQNN